MSHLPPALSRLIAVLKKLPGVGAKTAERYAFKLLEWSPAEIKNFSTSLAGIGTEIFRCSTCGCLQGETSCSFCDLRKRDPELLCIVSQPKDVYPIEETKAFRGLYHVLGTTFSPLYGREAEGIDLTKIRNRIISNGVKDVILAFDSTLEGDATALYLKEEMKDWNVLISRPAFGIPLGSPLDYVDPGTLTRALLGRNRF